jgi:hypothetical protein
VLITGDFQGQFLEIYLPEGEAIDAGSPIFVRAFPDKPGLLEVTFLRSDHFDTLPRKVIAARKSIRHLPATTLAQAAAGDVAATVAMVNLFWNSSTSPTLPDLICDMLSLATMSMLCSISQSRCCFVQQMRRRGP